LAPPSSSAQLPTNWLRSNPLLFLSYFLAAFLVSTRAVHAQSACATGPISYVFIDNHSIFNRADPGLNKRFAWAYRAANKLHRRTRKEVIQRELLFGPGDCFDPYLLEETERLLRSYDFLGQVDVFGVPQPDGSYHVLVDTRDQWSTQLDMRVGFDRGLAIEGFRLRESNLLGTGQELSFFYSDRDVTRDYGVGYGTRQLMGTRWDFRTSIGRTRAGNFLSESLAYPFLGEIGRYAARQSYAREDQFFDYIAVDSTRGFSQHVLQPVSEKVFDAGVGTRFGAHGNLTVLGAMVSYQRLTYPADAELAEHGDFGERMPLDTSVSAPLATQKHDLDNMRVGVLVGQRNIVWVKRRGLDSMHGEQDVPLGADVAFAFARSLPTMARDNDLVSTFKLNTGFEAGAVLFASRMRLDVRRDFDAPVDKSEWEDFYAEGEALNYWHGLSRHTLLLRASAAGAWHTTTPFQLTLGGDRNLRGYSYDRFPGGRRIVLNAEDRIYFGWPFPDVADIGGTIFFDVGRIWPGDVPFGRDSGWRSSAGVGLRGSFPAGGRSSFRIDFATPLDGGISLGRGRLIISASELLSLGALGSSDVQLLRSRNEGVAGELFRFRTR
jgi:hypothetical protein